jgi:hypothetical protein
MSKKENINIHREALKTFENTECTFNQMGNYPLTQPSYNCNRCGVRSICFGCINSCHVSCFDVNLPVSTINIAKFTCECGKENDHEIEKVTEKIKISPCNLKVYDVFVNLPKSYYCEDHVAYICSICYSECHSQCQVVKILEIKNQNSFSESSSSLGCQCKFVNHTSHFNFLLEAALSSNITSNGSFYNLNLTNKMFRSGVMSEITLYINKSFEKKIIKDDTLIKIFTLLTNKLDENKLKPYYFVDELTNLFTYERTVKYLTSFEAIELDHTIIQSRLISIIFGFHVKKDFHKIKSLSSSDFKTVSILDRINYRKFIISQNRFTNPLHQKYLINTSCSNISENNNFTIKKLIFSIGKILNVALENYEEFYFIKDYKLCLKFIIFGLKHMLFSNEELIILISSIYEFFVKFFEKFENFGDRISLYTIKSFAKIFYLTGVCFNDLITLDRIEKNEFRLVENKHYLQYSNEFTDKLLKLVVMNSKLFSNSYTMGDDDFEYKTTREYVNDSLNLFLACDNKYYQQLRSIKLNEFDLYENVTFYNFYHDDIVPVSVLKLEIEKISNDFFVNKIENKDEINNKIHHMTIMAINEFSNSMLKINEKLSTIPNIKNSKSFIKENNFYNKINLKLAQNFSFISYYDSPEKLEKLIQNFINNSLDISLLLNLYTFNCPNKGIDYPLESTNYIVDFLSLFLLNKSGFKYFITGNNLILLFNLFTRSPVNFLRFFHTIFKFANFYSIDLTNHKIIEKFKIYILKSKNLVDNGDKIVDLIYLIKIVNYISKFLENEDYLKIKNKVLNIILNSKFLDVLKSEEINKYFKNKEPELSSKTFLDSGNEKNPVHIMSLEVLNPSMGIVPNKGKIMNTEYLNSKRRLMSNEETIENLNDYFKSSNSFKIDSTINNEFPHIKLLYKFYFSYFKLCSFKSFFYFSKDEESKKTHFEIFSINENLLKLFIKDKSEYMTPNKRCILLATLRNLYFIEELDRGNIKKNYKHLNNSEFEFVKMYAEENFKNLILKNSINLGNTLRISEEKYDSVIRPKYDKMMEIKKVVELYIEEIKNFEEIISDFNRNHNKSRYKIRNYVLELLYTIKYIADFIFSQDLWNGINISLYKLAFELSTKVEFIRTTLNSLYPEKTIPIFKNLPTFLSENLKSEIFNKVESYKNISKIYYHLLNSNLTDFEANLKNIDKFNLLNFSPYALVEPRRYKYFYSKGKMERNYSNKLSEEFRTIYKCYKSHLKDFENSTFLNLIKKKIVDTQIDYGKSLISLLYKYFSQEMQMMTRKVIFNYITILNHMIFNDTENTQMKLEFLLEIEEQKSQINNEESREENSDEDENEGDISKQKIKVSQWEVRGTFLHKKFWHNMISIFKEYLVLNHHYSKNFLCPNDKLTVIITNQQLINFFQLLSEKLNTKFSQINFIPFENRRKSIFDILVNYLITISDLLNLSNVDDHKLPYDSLITLYRNIIDYLIEYIQSSEGEFFKKIQRTMENKIFRNLSKILITKSTSTKIEDILNKEKKEDQLLLLQSDQIKISTSRESVLLFAKSKFLNLLISYLERKPEKISFITKEYSISKLIGEIFRNFSSLTDNFKIKNLIPKNVEDLIFNDYKEIFHDFYLKNEEFRKSLKLKVCLKICQLTKFLVRVYNHQSFKEWLQENDIDPKRKDKKINKNNPNYDQILSYKIYLFLRLIIIRVDVNMNGENRPFYFVRPLVSYYLTRQTKNYFLKFVSRDNAYCKLSSLIENTDYFIFEMICNSHTSKKGFVMNFFNTFDYTLIEKINYLIILAHQATLIYYYYKSPKLPVNTYQTFDNTLVTKVPKEILIIAIVQIIMLFLVLTLWFIFKFPQIYQKNLMKNLKRKFVFKNTKGQNSSNSTPYKTIKEVYKGVNLNDMKIIYKINKKTPSFEIYRSIFSSIFFNREVNVLFFTFILLILYLAIGSPLILVIPVISAINLSSTLYDIFKALKLRWRQLLLVLVFTYLVIYIYTWISLLWLNNIFNYSDPVNPTTVK